MSFIVPTHNQVGLLCEFIEHIALCNGLPGPDDWEVVVVDDVGDEATRSYVQPHPFVKHILFRQERFNYATALNEGARHAAGDYLAFCNNDALFLCDRFIAHVIRTFEENPVLGILCTNTDTAAQPRRERMTPFRIDPQGLFLERQHHLWLWGAAYFMPHAVFDAMGGHEERLIYYGYEEAATARRALLAHKRVGWAEIETFHYGGASLQTGSVWHRNNLGNLAILEEITGVPNPYAGGDPAQQSRYICEDFARDAWARTHWKLDLGCGANTPDGYTGIDLAPGPSVGLAWDLRLGIPWPESTVDALRAVGLLQEISDKIGFMNECWRVLRPDGLFEIEVPSADPTGLSAWNDRSFAYYTEWLTPEQRRAYGIRARFEILSSHTLHPPDIPQPRVQIILKALK